MTNGQTKRWPNIIGLVEMFARLFGRQKAQAEKISKTEQTSCTENPARSSLVETLLKTPPERRRQQQCSFDAGVKKSRKTSKTSVKSKRKPKDSKNGTETKSK